MINSKGFVGLLLLLLALDVRAEGKCPAPLEQEADTFQLGIQTVSVLPNRLPQFTSSVPMYGPVFGIPVLGHLVQVQANYGTLTGFTMHSFEANFRYDFRLPLATPFLQAGTHYLRYRFGGQNHTYWGLNGAGGFSFDMNRSFDINLLVKVYLQDSALFSFGGGLAMLL